MAILMGGGSETTYHIQGRPAGATRPEPEQRSGQLRRQSPLQSIMYLGPGILPDFESHREETSITHLCSPLPSVWARSRSRTIPELRNRSVHWHFFTRTGLTTVCIPLPEGQSAGPAGALWEDWFHWGSRGLSTEMFPCYYADLCNSTLAALILGTWGGPSRALNGRIQSLCTAATSAAQSLRFAFGLPLFSVWEWFWGGRCGLVKRLQGAGSPGSSPLLYPWRGRGVWQGGLVLGQSTFPPWPLVPQL